MEVSSYLVLEMKDYAWDGLDMFVDIYTSYQIVLYF